MQGKSPLVTTEWLARHIDDENVIILDASVQISAKQLHIPSSRRFDFKNVFCDISSDLPGMMPISDKFNHEAKKLGINNNSLIVAYDNEGIFSAPRAWWMFNAMGHKNVYVLDGGLHKWINEKRPVTTAVTKNFQAGDFNGHLDASYIKTAEEILKIHLNDNVQIIDARPAGRFNGIEPEPREGLRSGHIPQSINIPFTSLLKDGEFLQTSELKTIFSNAKINPNKQQIFSCGSGITACVVLLASRMASYDSMCIYDGSWTEWGADHKYPISSL